MSPTVAAAGPVIGVGRGADAAAVLAQAVPLAVFTAPFNVTGQPAMSVPVAMAPEPSPRSAVSGASGRGAPCGVQVVARVGQDARLLAVARLLEQALGGFDHDPPGWT
ncbi:MAG: amidase family protein [bacterium]